MGTGYAGLVASSLLVRVVFGLLVVATLAAFFVTQRLKSGDPLVSRIFYQPWVSPNGDGRKDVVRMRFRLPRPDRVTVSVVDDGGDEVRRLADDRSLGARTHYFRWNGRTDDRRRAPDGVYRLRVSLRAQGRSLVAPRTVTVDTSPPRPRVLKVTPATILPGEAGPRGRARLRYEGPSDPAPRFTVFRSDAGGQPQEVDSFEGPRFRRIAEWDGLVGRRQRPAPDGSYAVAVTVRDQAGNEGSSPRRLPPVRGDTAPRTGVTVRYLSLEGSLEPLAPRAIARLRVGPRQRRFRWRINRLGSSRPLDRGRGEGSDLAIRIPARARSGVYLVRVQARGRRVLWPLAVTARSGGPLVVLPALTWQARNPIDDDRDGFPDTLASSPSVRTARPFAHGRLPPALRRETAPLLRFLDREELAYDVTTDLALARRPSLLRGRRALVFGGSEPWLTERLDRGVRAWVERGGRVASFGVDSFRRRVTLEPERLRDPSARESTNVFGERTSMVRSSPVAMVVARDGPLGLFAATGGRFGAFSSFERSDARVPGTRLLAAAGAQPERPAFVAYRLRKGMVARTGTGEWSRALARRGDVAAVTRRLWTVLSR